VSRRVPETSRSLRRNQRHASQARERPDHSRDFAPLPQQEMLSARTFEGYVPAMPSDLPHMLYQTTLAQRRRCKVGHAAMSKT
jgi:hypothetical protein